MTFARSSSSRRDLFASRYRLEAKLGEGTVGVVWRAFDSVRREDVALKVIHDDIVQDAGGFSGIVEVLRLCCRARHPALVTVYDFAEWNGQVYLAMELVRLPTLREQIQERRESRAAFSNREILSVLNSILGVLEEGARHALPHGGLKPENIWVRQDSSILLSELGINLLAAPEKLRSSAAVLNAQQYLAPELYERNAELGPSADQFALGVICSELHLTEPRDSANEGTGQGLTLIRQLTARKPKERFQTLSDLRARMDPPVPPGRRRPGAFLRARPGATAVLAVVATLLVATLAFVWNGFLAANDRRDQAQARAAARRNVRQIEEARMALLQEGLRRPEISGTLARQFSARREFELLEAALGATASSSTDASDLALAVRQRQESIRLARAAIKRLDEIDAFLDTLSHLRELQIPGAEEAFRHAARDDGLIIDQLEAGQFYDAAQTAERLSADLSAFFKAAWSASVRRARNAKQLWTRALEQHGAPMPNLIPASTESAADIDELPAIGAFLARYETFRRLADRYKSWAAELDQAPLLDRDHFTNSLGMRFVSVGPLTVSVWETRIMDFAVFAADTGLDMNRFWRTALMERGPTHPVTSIARIDAEEFCRWLTAREHRLGALEAGKAYMLPTDDDWSFIAGLENETGEWPSEKALHMGNHFPWPGQREDFSNLGNYFTASSANESNQFWGFKDTYHETAPVGRFPPNRSGLFDLGGNAWEWVSTPSFPGLERYRKGFYTARGGGYRTINLEQMKTGYRIMPSGQTPEIGFRCVIKPAEARDPQGRVRPE